MISELQKLRELTETLTGNGYLRDQAEEWEYALNSIPSGIYIIDTEFKIKFINKFLEQILKVENGSLIDKCCYRYIHGLNKRNVYEGWIDNKKEIFIERTYIKKLNGWFNITKAPIINDLNKLIGFICILQDVTSEEIVRKELDSNKRTLETLFNATPISMCVVNKHTRKIHLVNDCLINLLGYSKKELVGKSTKIFYDSNETFEKVGKICYNYLKPIKIKLIKKNGESVSANLRAADSDSKGLFILTFTDVT